MYDSLISNPHHGLEEQVMGEKGTVEAERGRELGARADARGCGVSLSEGEYDETLLQLEGFGEAVKTGRPLPGHLAFQNIVRSVGRELPFPTCDIRP